MKIEVTFIQKTFPVSIREALLKEQWGDFRLRSLAGYTSPNSPVRRPCELLPSPVTWSELLVADKRRGNPTSVFSRFFEPPMVLL